MVLVVAQSPTVQSKSSLSDLVATTGKLGSLLVHMIAQILDADKTNLPCRSRW